MRVSRLHLAVNATIIAIVVSASGHANGAEAVASTSAIQAKIQYCKTCHGLAGQGYRGSYPMPRLAGQQLEYLENQLRAFIERRRTNPVMFNVAHALSPSMLTAVATHFKDLDPRPLGGPQGNSWRLESKSTRTAFQIPRFLHAPPVTVRRPKVTGHFLAWQASSMTTSVESW